MINIPFNRCVVVTTLNLVQIIDRLQGAIYDPHFVSSTTVERNPRPESYQGKIQGFKFSATRIITYKDFHLPIFLSPTIEGKIASLYHGYEIALTMKVQSITVALLLTCVGGLAMAISTVLDPILTDPENYQNSSAFQLIVLGLIAVLGYFYFAAYRETKFFKSLFIKGFKVATQPAAVSSLHWSEDLFQEVGHYSEPDLFTAEPVTGWLSEPDLSTAESVTGWLSEPDLFTTEPVTGWLRKNLPSFPNPDLDSSNLPQVKKPPRARESRDLLQQNLPSFPKLDRPEHEL
jgi:hypothetical protein